MNLSRLAVLAVFSMMVMSAFVAVPAYNASADHENHDDEHDHDHDEDNGDHGDNGDHDDNDWRIENYDVVFEMEDLGNWLVKIKGNYPVEESDRFREDLAQTCEDMMGGNPGEITKECYEHFLTMENNDDHGNGHGCPPGLSDDDCIAMQECQNAGFNMSCIRFMYNYCYENPNMCDDESEDNGDNHPDHHDSEEGLHHHGDEDYHHDHDDDDSSSHADYDRHHDHEDDDSAFFNALFAYEAEHITAEEFMQSEAMQDWINDTGMDDTDGTDDGNFFDAHDNGLYDLHTFTAVNDGEVSIEENFLHPPYKEPTFICGDGETSIPFYQVNNNESDCEDGADEQWYDSNTPDDYSDDCQMWDDEDCEGHEVNWFDCHDGNTIWITQVNNGEQDCDDGEDEGWYNSPTSWFGDVFLMEGEITSEDIGTELTSGDIITRTGNYCDWYDGNEVYINCRHLIVADLTAGSSYTVVTKGNVEHDHSDENNEIIRYGTGSYNHVMHDSTGEHIMNITGNVTDASPMADFLDAKTTSFGLEFVMYHAETFIVGEEGFKGTLTSYGYDCDEYDCYSQSGMVFVYDSFDTTDTSAGLIGSIMKIPYMTSGEEPECPDDISSCSEVQMEMDLSPGDYVVVTTSLSYTQGGSGFGFTNVIHDEDGLVKDEWDGSLNSSYYDYDENGVQSVVPGDDRLHFPRAELESFEMELDCDDDETDEVESCDEIFMAFAVIFGMVDNMTAYENGEIDAVTAADNMLELFYMMDQLGFFENDEHDDHDDHMSLYDFDVSSWDSTNDLQNIVDWYNDQYYHHDSHTNMTVDEFLSMCEGISEDVNEEVAQCVLDKALSMMPDHDDHHGDEMWYCEDCNCQDMDDADGHGEAPDGYRQCGGHEDDHDDHGDHGSMVCYDIANHDIEFQFDNEEDCVDAGFMWVSANSGPGDHDDNDSDDNPALLDGIAGIQDPEDAGDNCRPSANDPHLIGNVEDNEGKPLTCSFEFKLRFEGVDNSLDTHVAYIPFQAQDTWTLKMMNTLGYEVTSCDNCVMSDDGLMNGTGPVNITFGKVEPKPDCDYTVVLSADGMAFDPVKLAINVGETVCWQWKDAAMAHNVVELEAEYDASMNLTGVDFGFSSGEPAMTVDFRHTFTADNKIHYYVCEPHAQLGMVGQITVGNGTDDPVQQALEDNEVPSIGFVVGSLVLVGAAGLRRRIH